MADSLQEKLRDMVKKWLDSGQHEVYGEMTHGVEVGIDDGGYGDPHEDTRPEFMREDEDGWHLLTRFPH